MVSCESGSLRGPREHGSIATAVLSAPAPRATSGSARSDSPERPVPDALPGPGLGRPGGRGTGGDRWCMKGAGEPWEGRPTEESELIERARRGDVMAYEELSAGTRPSRPDRAPVRARRRRRGRRPGGLRQGLRGARAVPAGLAVPAVAPPDRRQRGPQSAEIGRPARRTRPPLRRGSPAGRCGPIARVGGPRRRAAGWLLAGDRRAYATTTASHRGPLLPRAVGGRDVRGPRAAARHGEVPPLARARPAARQAPVAIAPAAMEGRPMPMTRERRPDGPRSAVRR